MTPNTAKYSWNTSHQTNVCRPTFAVRGGKKKGYERSNETVVRTAAEKGNEDRGSASGHRNHTWRSRLIRSSGKQGKMVTHWVTDVLSVCWWILTGHVSLNWPVTTQICQDSSSHPWTFWPVQMHQDPSLMTPPLFFHKPVTPYRVVDARRWMEGGQREVNDSISWSTRQVGWLFWWDFGSSIRQIHSYICLHLIMFH